MTSIMVIRSLHGHVVNMRIMTDLSGEHDLIDRVAGSMRTWISRAVRGDAPVDDGRTFIRFLEVYAHGLHHDREEIVLFPTVWSRLDLRADTAPIAVILDTHHQLAAILECMKALLEKPEPSAPELAELERFAIRYSRMLWHHIDAENSVLFPEIERRLNHAGIHELAVRSLTAGEEQAAAAGEELVQRYPPSDDSEIVRGEGCAMCPAYLSACAGIEHEWWNDWEWEELKERMEVS